MRKTAVETTHSSFLSNKLPAAHLQHQKLTISLTQTVHFIDDNSGTLHEDLCTLTIIAVRYMKTCVH
jgi:hypothetical protein